MSYDALQLQCEISYMSNPNRFLSSHLGTPSIAGRGRRTLQQALLQFIIHSNLGLGHTKANHALLFQGWLRSMQRWSQNRREFANSSLFVNENACYCVCISSEHFWRGSCTLTLTNSQLLSSGLCELWSSTSAEGCPLFSWRSKSNLANAKDQSPSQLATRLWSFFHHQNMTLRTLVSKFKLTSEQHPSFTNFKDLPPELRHEIWIYSLPETRIVTLGQYRQLIQKPAQYSGTRAFSISESQHTTSTSPTNHHECELVYQSNTCTPAISSVCC